LQCRNCGDAVDPRRVELGYDYCLKEECQQRCVRGVELAAVHVNKAADYYQRADEVVAPRKPVPASVVVETSSDDGPPPTARKPRRAPQPSSRPKSTLERLQAQEAALDDALEQSFARFSRNEITAQELDQERDRLIDAFNRQVRSENIRYRSMLRRRGRAH
jgi:hypothetical protein